MIQASPNLLERKNRSSAKAIQDEKAKKRAKKEKKHKRERDHSTNGDLENGFKHKKHKSKDKIEKAEAKAEKKRLKKEEKREKRRRKEIGKCYQDLFHFRWLNIKRIFAAFPISITLFYNLLKWNSSELTFIEFGT